ncbi:MAG: ABC transporter permease [Candidatus Thorarchaeota archaeon]
MNRDRIVKYGIFGIPIAILLFFLVIPVSVVIVQGLLEGPGSTFSEVISSPVTQKALTFTVTQSILSTLLALALGLPGAFLFSRLRFRGKSILKALIIVPFVLPPIVVVVGFLQIFGSGGILDQVAMTILNQQDSVLNLANGIEGIILAHAFYNIPLFILMISASLEQLNPEIEDVAEVLGVSPFGKLRRIIFPHIRAAVISASILTFLFCFMSFPIVLALGEGKFATIEVLIWYAFGFFDYGEMSSLALIQILITLVLAYSYLKTSGRSEQSKSSKSTIRTKAFSETKTLHKLLILGYICILGILILGPMISIVRAAVYDPFVGDYTLRGFTNLLNPRVGGGFVPFINSIYYAGLATLFAVFLGIPLAYAQHSKSRTMPTLTSMMILLPLGISSITMAYGLMLVIAVPTGLSINPWPLIVIAQTIIGIPFSAKAIEIALRKIDPAVLMQADSLGASRLQKLFFVELPLLAPGILVGAVFAFAMAIGEMSATIFLAREINFTLAVTIYRDLTVRKFVEAGASSLMLIIICFVAFLVIERFSEDGYGGTV